ncbi:MAG: DUF883 domain-containing protein [Acidobacteriota bacterium]
MAEDGSTPNAETARERDARNAGDTEGVASARDRFQRLSEDVRDRYADISKDVRRGAERASAEIRRGTERATAEFRRRSEDARETYQDVADNARRQYDRVRSDAGDFTREVGFYVRDNPGKALLIAAGVGFLLGLVVRGRGDDDDI